MSELISKKDVLSALDETLERITKGVNKGTHVYDLINGTIDISKCMILQLPDVQPEPVWTQTEKDGELTAGDEVMWKDLEVNDSRGLALWVDHMVINGHRKCCIMCIDGSAGTWDTDEFTKTGRHFDILSILEAMRT